MNVYYNDSIAGVPVIKLRKLLKEGVNNFLYVNTIARILELDLKQINATIAELEKLGYIEYIYRIDAWTNSIPGIILAKSPLKRRVKRTKAAQKIEDCIQRIKVVNQDLNFLYYIIEAYVTGEYLDTQISEINKVEIRVTMERKEKDNDKFQKLADQRINEANRYFSTIIEQVCYPITMILTFVKSGVHNFNVQQLSSNRDEEPLTLIYKFQEED